MHFSDIMGNLRINHISRYFGFLHWKNLPLQSLETLLIFFSSGLYSTEIWSINYALYFGSVKVFKNYLYWSVFSTEINRKIIFNCLLLFKLFLLVSKLFESSQ